LATLEHPYNDGRDTAADDYRGQTATPSEYINPEGGDTARNGHGSQGRTGLERRVPDGSDAAANTHNGQIVAAIKRKVSDGGNAVWDGHGSQEVTIECTFPDNDDTTGNVNCSRLSIRARNQGRDDLIIQHAIDTSIIYVSCINIYRSQGEAAAECMVPDESNAAADVHGGQGGAGLECSGRDIGNAVGDGHGD